MNGQNEFAHCSDPWPFDRLAANRSDFEMSVELSQTRRSDALVMIQQQQSMPDMSRLSLGKKEAPDLSLIHI